MHHAEPLLPRARHPLFLAAVCRVLRGGRAQVQGAMDRGEIRAPDRSYEEQDARTDRRAEDLEDLVWPRRVVGNVLPPRRWLLDARDQPMASQGEQQVCEGGIDQQGAIERDVAAVSAGRRLPFYGNKRRFRLLVRGSKIPQSVDLGLVPDSSRNLHSPPRPNLFAP